MDETDFPQDQYASFLVRLWRSDEPGPNGSTGDWQGEVEHIQSGRRWRFVEIEALLACLRLQTGKLYQML